METKVGKRTSDKTLRLYMVCTVADLPGRGGVYKDLAITWFMKDRKGPVVPYGKAIKGYAELSAKDRLPAEAYVNEFFVQPEVRLVKKYLEKSHGVVPVVKRVRLPVDCTKCWPRADWTVGGGPELIMLNKEPGYDLPFVIWGYYDTRHSEWVSDESSPAPHIADWFAIEHSTGLMARTCSLCGRRFELRFPLVVRLRGCHMPVCDACAEVGCADLLSIARRAEIEHNAQIRHEHEHPAKTPGFEVSELPF